MSNNNQIGDGSGSNKLVVTNVKKEENMEWGS